MGNGSAALGGAACRKREECSVDSVTEEQESGRGSGGEGGEDAAVAGAKKARKKVIRVTQNVV